MSLLRLLYQWATRPPYVHIPFETPCGHHRCICGDRADDHLGHTGWCQRCGCSYYQQGEAA